MDVSRLFRGVNGLCLFAFAALLATVPLGYAVAGLAAAMAALLAGAWVSVGRRWCLDREDALWLLAPLLFGLVWLADVARSGEWPVGEGHRGLFLPLWPLAAALIVMAWRHFPPGFTAWRLGVGLGALSAGALAGYQHWGLGHARAGYQINAIPFGDLSLLLGMLSLIALLERMERRRPPFGWGLALGVAALAGLVGSLLSGTRGGWISLPVLTWLWYGTFYHVVSRRALLSVSAVLAVLLIAAVAVPHTGVAKRVNLAVDQVQGYFQDGEKATSVGIRLEMWRAGAHLFLEKPLTGWGEGGLQRARNKMVDAGVIHRGVERYDQLHSDVIDTAARRGLPGLASLLLLYGIPLVLFSRRLSQNRSPRVRALALSGVAVVLAFMDFGLTQTMLRDVHGLAGYLGLTLVCWVLLRAAETGNLSSSVVLTSTSR